MSQINLEKYHEDILLDSKLCKINVNTQKEKKKLLLTKNNVRKLYRKWFIRNAVSCKKCNAVKNLTIDHIIPISILKDLNIDVEKTFKEENLQILCMGCNQMKSNHLDFSIKETKILLLKYLNSR